MALTRPQIIWATAYVLAMDRPPLPNNIPPVVEEEEPEEEEEENELNS